MGVMRPHFVKVGNSRINHLAERDTHTPYKGVCVCVSDRLP